jgi:hypothetical protein
VIAGGDPCSGRAQKKAGERPPRAPAGLHMRRAAA